MADAAGRGGHRRAAVPVRDAAAGPAGGRRPAAHAGRAGDQVAGRDHAADPGRGHGGRRLSGHRGAAQARRPGERDRRAGQPAALRDGLGPGRGDQRDLRRALQPAPAQLHRPPHPPRRPGVLRHHPLLQRLPHLLLPDVQRGLCDPGAAGRLQAGREWIDAAIELRPARASRATRSRRLWPTAADFGFASEMDAFGLQFGTASGSACTSGRSSRRLNSFASRSRSRPAWCSRWRPTARPPTASRPPGSRRRSWSPRTAPGPHPVPGPGAVRRQPGIRVVTVGHTMEDE